MRLKDNWPETGLLGRWGRWANQVSRIINGATGYDGAQVFVTDQGLQVYGGGGGSLNLSGFAFGIVAETIIPGGRRVHLRGGLVQVGTSVFNVGSTLIDVETSPSFIFMRAHRRDGNPALMVAANLPADTGSTVHCPLYEYRLTAGPDPKISLYAIHHVGSIRF